MPTWIKYNATKNTRDGTIPEMQVIPTAMRAAYQACGANCMGGERFIVQESVFETFVERIVAIIRQMRQGPPLGDQLVDCGAICMPGLREKVHIVHMCTLLPMHRRCSVSD